MVKLCHRPPAKQSSLRLPHNGALQRMAAPTDDLRRSSALLLDRQPPFAALNPARRRAGWLWRIGAQDSRMLQNWVRQPPHSRARGSGLQTHLRELVAQSSHGRPARSPTNFEWHRLPLPTKYGPRVLSVWVLALWGCGNGAEPTCQPCKSNAIKIIAIYAL